MLITLEAEAALEENLQTILLSPGLDQAMQLDQLQHILDPYSEGLFRDSSGKQPTDEAAQQALEPGMRNGGRNMLFLVRMGEIYRLLPDKIIISMGW